MLVVFMILQILSQEDVYTVRMEAAFPVVDNPQDVSTVQMV